VTKIINNITILNKRVKESPALFNNMAWQKGQGESFEFRKWVYNRYKEQVSHFVWNENTTEMPIIPVVHGCDESIGRKICETGFANLGILDAGWYGKGMYFTSSCLYAIPYYASKKKPALVIAYICPGNVYPVIEMPKGEDTLNGQPMKNGYNSHFVVTTKNGFPPAEQPKKGRFYDEFVIPQESQIMPAFLLSLGTKNLATLLKKWNRPVEERDGHVEK